MLFTAAIPEYARAVASKIDPDNKIFRYIFTRANCLQTKNGFFIKDLRLLGRDLSKVIIVDDLIHSFGFHIDNGIPILEFRGNPKDEELLYLTEYLLELSTKKDIISYHRHYIKVREVLTIKFSD